MIPGPTILIKCPHCGGYAKKETLLSGNTFGASLWSDCKQIASMLPEFPQVVLCKHCNQFYWVEDAKEVDSIWLWDRKRYSKEKELKWANTKFIEFPTYEEYLQCLESDAIRNRSDEKYVRIQLWWLSNDHIRGKYPLINLFRNKMIEFNCINIESLLDLLDQVNTTELIKKAEIHRNLGRFDESKALIESITDEKYAWIKVKFLEQIDRKKPELFRLR
jgi:hypothetical protein